MSDRRIRVGLVQMAMTDDPVENTDRALDLTREAVAGGAQVVCLPELFRSRYFCQSEDPARFDLAEPVPGPTTLLFEPVARESGTVLVLSLFERRAPGLYHNTAAVLDGERGYVGKYRKMHIPDDPRYYEKYYFTPGDLGFLAWPTGAGTLGVLVCWDQWYPEAARLTALQGAEILFYPTAIGWHPEEADTHGSAQHGAWETIQRSHAVANGCFVVSVNRTGFEPDPAGGGGIRFWGHSFVAGPDGEILHRMGDTGDAVAVVELDLERIAEQRHGWPFFRDRRVDAYANLTLRFDDREPH
jgi:N-carbamoylputrescine amidase